MIPFWWTGAAGGNDASEFAAWFLRTGVWDNAGQWVDAVSWPGTLSPWFLGSGVWVDALQWVDAIAWPGTVPLPAVNVTWFLGTGAWNLLGLWDDSRSWT